MGLKCNRLALSTFFDDFNMKQNPLKTLGVRTLLGLFQGIVLSILYAMNFAKWNLPTIDPIFFFPLFIIFLFIPTLIILGFGNLRIKTMGFMVVFTVLILTIASTHAIHRQVLPSYNLPAFFIFTSIALFISQSLILSGDQDKKIIANYSTYFNISWKLGLQLLLALAFAVLFWLLLYLGTVLFDMIHLNFFYHIVTQFYFFISATCFAVAIALHVTDVNVQMTQGVRVLCLKLLSWLLPLIAVIVSVFLLSLFFTGLRPLWQTGYAGSLLLISTALVILLINAVDQDHSHELNIFQRHMVTLSCYLLIPMMILAFSALTLRVQQYGWTVNRIYAAAGMIIGACYAIGYVLSILMRKVQPKLFEYTNLILSILILIIYIALHTPIADPARLAVMNQVNRLKTGQVAVEKFDFYALRYQGQRYGQEALKDIELNWQGAKVDDVRERIQNALNLKPETPQFKPLNMEEKNLLLIVNTKDKPPASFYKQQWQVMDGTITIPTCLYRKGQACNAWVLQDADNKTLILILSSVNFIGFKENANGTWSAIGSWNFPYGCENKILETARKGQLKLVPPIPAKRDIEVFGVRLDFNQNFNSMNCN